MAGSQKTNLYPALRKQGIQSNLGSVYLVSVVWRTESKAIDVIGKSCAILLHTQLYSGFGILGNFVFVFFVLR